jgi:hypothetical protein
VPFVRMTVDLYGQWLPMTDRGAVDGLDEVHSGADPAPSGSKTVAAENNAPECAELQGGFGSAAEELRRFGR